MRLRGFSIDLTREIAAELGREVSFTFVDEFPDMLARVTSGEFDGAVANISITSDREAVLDFSRPIFGSGLQILVSGSTTGMSVWGALLRWELAASLLVAFGVLFGVGMLMWAFERKNSGYFNENARDAMFPSFWWALNLVVNGGFEVNVPRSAFGRILGVVLVVSSLFVVSFFVANITAVMTVDAISGSVRGLDDLRGRTVGTTDGSTASAFLGERGVAHVRYATFADVTTAFEEGELDAIVFDGPILAHYLTHEASGAAYLLERNFRPEDYGIALPQGSPLREQINLVLLRLQETGRYEELRLRWFGDPT